MTDPRPGRWTSRPLKTRIPYGILHSAVSIPWVLAMFGYILTHPHLKHIPLWLSAMNGVGVIVVGCLYGANELRCLRLTKADRALSEAPEGVEEFFVEITFHRGTQSLGMDRGVLYFDKGLMGFSGSRTSFLLAATDLIYPRVRPPFDFDIPFKPLPFKVGEVNGTLTVRPLLGQGRRYRRKMRRFLWERQPSQAERQWPPIYPYDSMVDKLALDDRKGQEAIVIERLPRSHVEP